MQGEPDFWLLMWRKCFGRGRPSDIERRIIWVDIPASVRDHSRPACGVLNGGIATLQDGHVGVLHGAVKRQLLVPLSRSLRPDSPE